MAAKITKTQLDELEARKLKAEIRKLNAETQTALLEYESNQREFNEKSATADRNGIYHFFGAVKGDSVASAMIKLQYWVRQGQTDITLIFNSPGGGVIDGLALYDELSELKRQGVHFTTIARGMAASMGGILLQAGDKRVIGSNAHMLIHEVSSGAFGKMTEIEDEIKFSKRLQDRCVGILAERANLSAAEIKRRWKRKDWWLGATETVELGFADTIG